MHKYDFDGRTAIVTGGAKGIGYACAERLLDSGAAVSIWDLDEAALDQAVTTLSAKGDVQGLVCDAGDWDAVEAATGDTMARFGRLDAMIANAGIERVYYGEFYRDERSVEIAAKLGIELIDLSEAATQDS